MDAVPLTGFPEAFVPLHTTKRESHTPPQTRPLGETVATAGFEELKVKVVGTLLLAELTAEAETVSTWPATSEAEVGDTRTCETVLLLLEEDPPPQPVKNPVTIKRSKIAAQDRAIRGRGRAYLPRFSRIR